MSMDEMLRGGGPQRGPDVEYGYVSSNQPVPTHYDDPLFVIIPDFDTGSYFTCDHWPKMHGATFPAAGDDVAVIRDNRGNRRCVWWAGVFTPWPDPGA